MLILRIILVSLLVIWLMHNHRLERYLRGMLRALCWRTLLSPLGLVGLSYYTPRNAAVRNAERAATVWFQHAFGVDNLPDIAGVLYIAAALLLGLSLFGFIAGTVAVACGLTVNPGIWTFLGWGAIASAAATLLFMRWSRRVARPPRLFHPEALTTFRGLQGTRFWKTAWRALCGIAVLSFIVGMAGGLPSLFHGEYSTFWNLLLAAVLYWLFGWWGQVFLWLFALPKFGYTSPACHWPLRLAAAPGRERGGPRRG